MNRWCSVNLYLVSPKVLKLLLISSRTSSMEINDLPGARNLAQSMVVGEIKTIMGVGRVHVNMVVKSSVRASKNQLTSKWS